MTHLSPVLIRESKAASEAGEGDLCEFNLMIPTCQLCSSSGKRQDGTEEVGEGDLCAHPPAQRTIPPLLSSAAPSLCSRLKKSCAAASRYRVIAKVSSVHFTLAEWERFQLQSAVRTMGTRSMLVLDNNSSAHVLSFLLF